MTEALQLWKKIAGKGDGGSDDQRTSQGKCKENFLSEMFFSCIFYFLNTKN